MIEDNIRVLREAARITANNNRKVDKSWCIVAGNASIVDDIAYKAIASNNAAKILFREHVTLKDGKLDKIFDFIMLYGSTIIIDEFMNVAQNNGGACIQISRDFLIKYPNLMVFIAPEDIIKLTVSTIEKSKIPFGILKESQTTAFIDIEIDSEVKLPNFIKSVLKPFYNANEVVLSTILISVDKDEDVGKVQSIATSNRIFVIDFRDIVTED